MTFLVAVDGTGSGFDRARIEVERYALDLTGGKGSPARFTFHYRSGAEAVAAGRPGNEQFAANLKVGALAAALHRARRESTAIRLELVLPAEPPSTTAPDRWVIGFGSAFVDSVVEDYADDGTAGFVSVTGRGANVEVRFRVPSGLPAQGTTVVGRAP